MIQSIQLIQERRIILAEPQHNEKIQSGAMKAILLGLADYQKLSYKILSGRATRVD